MHLWISKCFSEQQSLGVRSPEIMLCCGRISVEYFSGLHKCVKLLGPGDLFRVPTPTPTPLWQNHVKTSVFENILLLFLATCPKKELQHSLLVRRQLSGEKAGAGRFGA